jgi:hypothetical protein
VKDHVSCIAICTYDHTSSYTGQVWYTHLLAQYGRVFINRTHSNVDLRVVMGDGQGDGKEES